MLKPLTFLLMLAAPMAEAATLIENFEGTPVTSQIGGTLTGTQGYAPHGYLTGGHGSIFLRSAHGLSLTFGALSASTVNLSLDLALIDSWEGRPEGGPDRIGISVNGSEILKLLLLPPSDGSTIWGNEVYVETPGILVYRDHAATGHLGFGQWQDDLFCFDILNIPHLAGGDFTLSLQFPEGEGIDIESFAIDNVRLEFATVPLPASLPLFLAGLGALGMMRRRKGL